VCTVAAGRLWMSPQPGQDTIAFHFTWKRVQGAVDGVFVEIGTVLAPFHGRAQRGKPFIADAAMIARLYELLPDFICAVEWLDPRGACRNPSLETHLLGGHV
nr:FAD-binding protein [Candidatus Dormibacteraeota bacterium]